MIDTHGHSRLGNRYTLRAALVCETALHVGSGGANDVLATSDMPVARDGNGRPYIPGSSFRGALRAGLESLLLGLGREQEKLRVCDPLQKVGADAPETLEKSCSSRIQAEREGIREDPEQPPELTEERAFEIAWRNSCARV